MKSTSLQLQSLTAPDRKIHTRIIHKSSQGLLLRVGAILLLGGLVVSGFYSASSAKTNKSAAPQAPRQVAVTTLKSLPTNVRALPAAKASFSALPLPLPPAGPTLGTYAAGCTTPKTDFAVGDTVCVKVTGFPTGSFFPYRLLLGNANSTIIQSVAITSDPQTLSFTVDATSVIGGVTVDNRGTWQVVVVDPFFLFPVARTTFTVSDPQNKTADIAVATVSSSTEVQAGSQVNFRLEVKNYGPDSSLSVQLTDGVPANTTFSSFQQLSGPAFVCSNPSAGSSSGTSTCTLASLAWPGPEAVFLAIYDVNAGTPANTQIVNTANVTSNTDDQNLRNNSTSASVAVVGSSAGQCSLNCPDNITVIADTTEGGQRGAHVTFDAAEPTGSCGAITASPASGTFFPAGTNVVSVTSELNGGSCSFTITVEDQGTNPPSISCPANKQADADSNCSATVNVGTASATGNNVTVIGTRSDGLPMYTCDANGTNCVRRSSDDPFPSGVTTITWKAYSHDVPGPYASADDEEAHRTGVALCSQTVTVNDVTPPTITAPNTSASADANCMAPVPNYAALATVSDNCACASSDTSVICDSRQDITITQSPAAGTMVGLGPHTISLTANDGSSNNGGAGNSTTIQVTFTVNDTTAPVITCPASILNVPTEPGICAAHVTTGTATATDNCDNNPTITASRSDGRPLTDTYPRGTTTITWTATDASGNHSSCTQTISVVDNEPPVIVLNGQTPSMWPPNHKYQTFQVTNFVTAVTDNCDTIGVSSVVIEKVTSDEIENGNGDGNTLNDIVIAANCKSVQLRSEREGNSDGRVYTITFKVSDTSGNVGRTTARVVVQHNPGETAVDSGVHYTVNGSCP